MMNPLSRKMFRDPMSSRKPAGILASSAPMMTSAQKAMAKNQPMKAQTGASVNTSNYMSAIAQLTQQGDIKTLTNILQDTRLPTGVRTAARDAIGSLQPKPRNVAPQVRPQVGPPMADIPSIQGPPAVSVPGYPVGTDSAVLAGLTDDQLAARMSAEANVLNAGQSKPQLASSQVGPSMARIPSIQGPPAVTVPGYSVGEDGAITSPLTDDQLAARMSAEMNALNAGQNKTTTVSPSVSQGIQNVQAALAKPTSPAITPGSDPLIEQAREQAQSGTSGISNMLGGAFAYPGDINKALDYAYPEPPPGASRLDRGLNFLQRGAFATIRAPYDVGAQIAGFGQETEKFLTEPYYTPEELYAIGQSPQGRPFGVTDTPGLDILGVFKGDEQAKDIEPDITDMGVGADTDTETATTTAEQQTAGESKAVKGTTGIDTSKLTQMLADHQAGESKVTPLNDQELFTPEAVKVAAMEIPKEATLSDIEEKYKELFDYDPKQLEGDKKDAFWRNLTMAGLAMAAGESDNALTNIAKGAMVGLDTYGKEVGELTKADREAKREDRRTKLQLIQNENDKNIAMAQLKNAYNMDKAKIEQDAQQFGVTSSLQTLQLQIDEGYKQQQGEIALVTALNDANYKKDALQVQRDQLSLEQFKTNVANSSELAQLLYPLGTEYAIRDEKGNITVNPAFLQQMEDNGTLDQYIDLAITGKEKSPTDTTLNAQAIAEQQGITLAEARTVLTLGKARLEEGATVSEVLTELNIVPGSAGGVNPTPDANTMATAAQQGLVWDPNATSTSGKQGAFVSAQQ